MNLNQIKFAAIVAEAKSKCAGNRRCERAIDRAVAQIEANPYMTYTDGELLVLSPRGEIYVANGSCQCKAYASGQLCWHRTLAKLLKRYFEAKRRPAAVIPKITRRNGRVYAGPIEV